MEDLFQREQMIFDGVAARVEELHKGYPLNPEVFEELAKEYGYLLKQLRKVVRISDRASEVLISDKKFRQEKISELENELLQSQISIMISQIGPHFIFNALTAIKELCHIDPQTASEAVGEFAHYLRGNLDSLTIKKPIPFEKELRHVENYLSLEKKRFGDRISIVYDIKARDFLIPVLTLQPVAENAVKHGVTKREEGGTVWIATHETETDAVITVKDDGVGFDTSVPKRDERGQERCHVGIENVRSRLVLMCGGSLSMQSEPGAGATAVITIPKR